MNKISYGQLFTLLTALKAFSLICSGRPADTEQMLGAAISVILQMMAAIPMLMLYRKKNFSLKNEMLLGKLGKLLYSLFFILWGAVSLTDLWGVTTSVYFPVDSSFKCAVLIGIVCLYISFLGISATARSSTAIFGLLIFSIAVLAIGAYPKIELSNLLPDVSGRGVISSAVDDFCTSGDLPVLFVLLEYTKTSRSKGTSLFFIGKLVLIELVSFIEITVLGRIMDISDYPFFSAGAHSQPFSVQRSDALYMILFTMLCVISITLLLSLTSVLVKEIIPGFKYSAVLSIVLMLSASWAMNRYKINAGYIYGGLILLLAVILPLIMLIRRTVNEKTSHSDSRSADHTDGLPEGN